MFIIHTYIHMYTYTYICIHMSTNMSFPTLVTKEMLGYSLEERLQGCGGQFSAQTCAAWQL